MKTKLVMLETSQYSDIQIKLDGKLHLEDGSSIALKSYAQFYLIDTDTEIKEDDWVIRFYDGKPHQIGMATPKGDELKRIRDKRVFKVISSTYSSLIINAGEETIASASGFNQKIDKLTTLPLLSESSIKLAIDYYNRTSKKEVEVEVEEIHEKIVIYNFAMGIDEEVISKIKLNPEGKVDITLPQEKITITIPTDIAETLVAVIDSRIGTSDDDEFNRQMHIVLKEIDKKLRR
jgi:hypothetical protein